MAAKKIFVIDDDEDIRALLENYLTSLGYEVRMAKTAVEAEGLFQDGQPDLILLDVMMPELNGIEFAVKIKAKMGKSVPIIVMTGLKDEETARDALEIGSADFLAKPFRMEELRRKIERILSSP